MERFLKDCDENNNTSTPAAETLSLSEQFI